MPSLLRASARLLGALVLGAAAACSSAPVTSIPAPLPEADAWTVHAGDDAAFLGLVVEANEAGTLEALQTAPGVRVLRVVQNSPAARQGLRVGDVLLSVDGAALSDPVALDVLLARAAPGDALRLEVRRGDTVFDVEAQLAGGDGAALSAPEARYVVDPARTRAGWRSTPDGVQLAALADDSPLRAAGLQPGVTLLALDELQPLSARELVRHVQSLEPGARVELRLRDPDGTERSVRARLYDVPTRVTRARLPILWDYSADADGTSADLHLLDFWFFELFQFHRRGTEREWVLLELFGYELFAWGSGTGELRE